MTHDRYCLITSTTILDCPICSLLKAARDEEREKFNQTWKANLPGIERRNYVQGWTDAVNGKRLGP